MGKLKLMTTAMVLSTITLAAGAQNDLRSGIEMSNLDKTVQPANDFYQYACGGWMKNNPLPASYARYGSFDQLAENNNKRINGILDELLHGSYQKGTIEQKLSDLYKLAMDSVRRNNDGVKPAMEMIKRMEAAKTMEQLFDCKWGRVV